MGSGTECTKGQKLMTQNTALSERDRHGDIWTLGDDGLMHTPETAPFPREHVEKKWGPLVPVPSAQQKIARLSQWIDDSYPTDIGAELHARRRIDKLMEECGEVGQALSGWFGENPRKGFTHTIDDVLAELLDVMVTAAGAYESFTGNRGIVLDRLDAKMDGLLTRVGLNQPPRDPAS